MGGCADHPRTASEIYRPVAAHYERLWAPLLRPFGRMLLDRLPLVGARRVLDLGCGVGGLLPDIQERAPDAVVLGADLTEAMLRRAPARFARIVMDSTRLALAAGSIDVIVTTFMFQHLEDPVGVLGSVRALLRGGGSMGLATWGTGETFPAMDVWDEELDRLGVPAAPGPQPAGRERTNAVEKMVSALDEAGFVDATSESVEWRRMWELDEFVEWRGVLGPSGRRLSLLDPTERERVVDAARQRVVTAGPEALRHRDEVLLSVARSPS